MATKKSANSLLILQLALALFFFLLGLSGIVNYSSDAQQFGRNVVAAFGGQNDVVGIVISILLLISGVVLLAGPFLKGMGSMLKLATLVIVVIWLVRIVILFFVNDIFEPDFLTWLQLLSLDVTVLVAAWLIHKASA